ncbi:hypothetical protein QFZ24_005178 [Streptomyces phaeochromogenes]|uniref:DUF5994 family protein n=1 Tax=Streptomyces phaeochromogenes TaxID=1923 RepID=UPI00278F6D67|nr:DUF5994 family protein [Streptomyces phaeochromogenes]MDQ0951255.1 hypothetical protein [Streptomyces phaeochromogenes]
MSATTDRPPLRIVPFRAPTARLALKPTNTPPGLERLPEIPRLPGLLDGAWWPRSRDLTHELSALADVLDPLGGRITRIAVNCLYWPVVPRRIPVNGHVVKVGWFTTELDPHKILLLSHTTGRWNLLVIPPESSSSAAARLMAAASDSTGPSTTATATELIAAEHALHGAPATDGTRNPAEAWQDDETDPPLLPLVKEAALARPVPPVTGR